VVIGGVVALAWGFWMKKYGAWKDERQGTLGR